MVFRTSPDGTLLGEADGKSDCALKLYYEWRSTSTRRVRIVLHEKGLEWEGLHIEKGEEYENYLPWYAKLNPLGVVPTLVHGDKVIIESNVINEYLEDTFPEVQLRPDGAYEKARMRVWLIRSENEAHDAINPISERARAVRKARFTSEQLLKQVSACPQPGRRALKVDRVLNGYPRQRDRDVTPPYRLAFARDGAVLRRRPLACRAYIFPGRRRHGAIHGAFHRQWHS
jgi:glutathione S-transferase